MSVLRTSDHEALYVTPALTGPGYFLPTLRACERLSVGGAIRPRPSALDCRGSLARPTATRPQVIVSCKERIDRPLGAKLMFDSTNEIDPHKCLRTFEVAPAILRDGSSENESCPGRQGLDTEYRQANGILGLLIVACVSCDFLMVPILSSASGPPRIPGFPLFLAVIGCVLAQGNLLAAWLAWCDEPFFTRLTRHWIVATLLYLVWAAGLALGQLSHFAEVSLMVGLSVPLVSVSAQLPLWIARQTFGWRLVQASRLKNDAGPSPLSIRHLMLATLVVAISLALARLAPSRLPGEPPEASNGRWIIWTFAFLVASGVSTIAVLPAGAMLLRTRRFHRGLVFAGLYAAFFVGILWLVVFTARRLGLSVAPLAIVVGISSLIFSFAGTVMLAALAARTRGYRLVWGRGPKGR